MTACIRDPASCISGIDPEEAAQAPKYQDVCSLLESTEEMIPFGKSRCDEAQRPSCTCQIDNDCQKDGDIFLYLNRTQPQVTIPRTGKSHVLMLKDMVPCTFELLNLLFSCFMSQVIDYVDMLFRAFNSYDTTCGGLPFYSQNQIPMSYGRPCENNTDCIPPRLRSCTPGVDCHCCANVSKVCSTWRDCLEFTGLFSTCGCQKSNPTVSHAILHMRSHIYQHADMHAHLDMEAGKNASMRGLIEVSAMRASQ
jgi:hypothetical protein